MIRRTSDSNGGRHTLCFRHGRNDGDVRKQRQAAECGVHIQRLKPSRSDHENQLPLRALDDRCDRNRPHWRETRTAGGKHNAAGVVAMAHSTSPDSASCQFYITLAAEPSLDGKYAIFGGVINGMNVVNSIAIGDVMTTVSVQQP